jgi:hypothetical protein
MQNRPALFRGRHFEDVIIILCVRWYLLIAAILTDSCPPSGLRFPPHHLRQPGATGQDGDLLYHPRRRSPQLLKQIVLLPRSAWRTIELDVPSRKYRTPRVFEQKVSLAGATFRQLFIQDLGHDEPTILLTNQRRLSAKKLITRYAQRMLIENALSDAVRLFMAN